MTAALKPCADAIAEVREKYAIGGDQEKSSVWLRVDRYGRIGKDDLFTGTRAECQAWIDLQAARACRRAVLESLLPVSDEVVEAGAEAMDNCPVPLGTGHIRGLSRALSRSALTAAIRHLTATDKGEG